MSLLISFIDFHLASISAIIGLISIVRPHAPSTGRKNEGRKNCKWRFICEPSAPWRPCSYRAPKAHDWFDTLFDAPSLLTEGSLLYCFSAPIFLPAFLTNDRKSSSRKLSLRS